ncbi:hypothetical protein G3578_09200 [Brevibacillus sp. SYP-B805]|uniref:hypothetical protein n=1 Tax=Brevibacillus sp. SYP-B805 TaxID=1578199 RepID=UPI0013EC920A|nr:hypothetical protein [Brevibacillus sp. SYP-B805]NGQ95330.1 hypothetical protein [Brevibacillus sp. SYP-B805]
MFSQTNGYSPVAQDFIWLGEYVDGTHLAEFDFVTKEENSFYSLQKDKLIRFGLIGHGHKMFYEADGRFNISGRVVDFIYSTSENDFFLTSGFSTFSRDPITYKDAVARLASFHDPHTQGGFAGNGSITQFTFGYKSVLEVHGVKFNFKVLCHIPFNSPAYMNLRLVADTKLNGKFQIRVNGLVVSEFHAPLEPNVGGELNWLIQ